MVGCDEDVEEPYQATSDHERAKEWATAVPPERDALGVFGSTGVLALAHCRAPLPGTGTLLGGEARARRA